MLGGSAVREDGGEKAAARFSELVREGLQYRFHGRDWYLHGPPTGKPIPGFLKPAHSNDISYVELAWYIIELAKAYSWCLAPWGVYGTGQMIALVSEDPTIFAKVSKYLVGSNPGLVVSSYTEEELREKRFKGAIFRAEDENRGHDLWTNARGPTDSALVLAYQSNPALPSQLPANAKLVCELLGHHLQPVLRRWIRVEDENALKECLKGRTVIVTAPGLDERLMWLALQDFGGVANHVNQDPFDFGLQALKTASWIYVPRHDDQGWEAYINRDPAETTRLLEAESLRHSSGFCHKYFC